MLLAPRTEFAKDIGQLYWGIHLQTPGTARRCVKSEEEKRRSSVPTGVGSSSKRRKVGHASGSAQWWRSPRPFGPWVCAHLRSSRRKFTKKNWSEVGSWRMITSWNAGAACEARVSMLPIASMALAGAFHGMHAQVAPCVHKGCLQLHHSIAYMERVQLILNMRTI